MPRNLFGCELKWKMCTKYLTLGPPDEIAIALFGISELAILCLMIEAAACSAIFGSFEVVGMFIMSLSFMFSQPFSCDDFFPISSSPKVSPQPLVQQSFKDSNNLLIWRLGEMSLGWIVVSQTGQDKASNAFPSTDLMIHLKQKLCSHFKIVIGFLLYWKQ